MDRPILLLYTLTSSILILGNHGLMAWSETKPPVLIKGGLAIQEIVSGLDEPSGFEFVGERDILVTQKNDGKVKLLRNFDLKKYSMLDENVFNHTLDSAITGIASARVGGVTYVFLFYTENSEGGGKISTRNPGSDNRVYRYTWDPLRLTLSNRTLTLDLPFTSGEQKGIVVVGIDKSLYTVIGDLASEVASQNVPEEDLPKFWIYHNRSKSGAILKTTLDGGPSSKNLVRSTSFYGCGIRSPSDLTFDPVTEYLWVIDAGPEIRAESNPSKADLGAGIRVIQGKVHANGCFEEIDRNPSYRGPIFLSSSSYSPSALLFFNSTELGDEYLNDLFVGDANGKIYYYDLVRNRENIATDGTLSEHIFAEGFGPISDLKVGPDNALYILTSANSTGIQREKNTGSIYRVAESGLALPLKESISINADFFWLISTTTIVIAILISLVYFRRYRHGYSHFNVERKSSSF